MQEQAQKREKRLHGIAGVIVKQLKPIENKEIFIEKYSDLELRVLLNPIDSKYAAIVNLSHGRFEVEDIKNEQKEKLSKDVLNWNAMLETSTLIFLKIAMGELGLVGQAKLIMTRKMKVKGLANLLKFASILKLSDVVVESKKEPKETKKLRKTVKEAKTDAIFSRKAKFITAGVVGMTLPSILTILFMYALDTMGSLWNLAHGDVGLFYSMVLFNSFNMVSDIVLLGKGYWYVFIIWGVTGLFIGLLSRDILKSLIIDGIVIGIAIIMYSVSVSIYSASYPEMLVDTLISESSYLYPGLISGPEIFLSILIQITIHSFALPILVLFTLVGGLINPRPEYYTVFDENVVKLKKKQKGPEIPKKGMVSHAPSSERPPEAPKEQRYLESYPTT